jgi:hypothetical protein
MWACLGNGKRDSKIYKPELIPVLSENQIKDISCGFCHTIILTTVGDVYSWGYNKWGQIGNESEELYVLVPTLLKGFNGEKVKAISCGFKHSLALTMNGMVFKWGGNTSKEKSNKPVLIELKFVIKKISCGANHNLLLSNEGEIFVFGDNESGQLGIGDRVEQLEPKPIQIENEEFLDISTHSRENISIVFCNNGSYYIWGISIDNQFIIKPQESEYKSICDIYAIYLQITNKAVVFNEFGPNF